MNEIEISRLLRLGARPAERRGWRCPDDTRLAAYAEGRLAATEREELELHLADCAFCLGQVGSLVRDARPDEAPAVPGRLLAAARMRRAGSQPWLRPAVATLAAAALVAVALSLLRPAGQPPAPTRSDSAPAAAQRAAPPGEIGRPAPATARTPRLLRPLDGARVAATALELEWQPAAGATSYTVQLLDPAGSVLWEGRTAATRLAVPPEAGLAAGDSLYVWVIARLPSGASLRSPAVAVQIAPP